MAQEAEQRNPYDGDPPRPWIIVRLAGKDGATQEFKLVADTGNPFELIIDATSMAELNHGDGPPVETNFGTLAGGWLLLAMPELGLTKKVLGHASDVVVASVKSSHPGFQGLAGLPLLRMLEYGGDADAFWIRRHR